MKKLLGNLAPQFGNFLEPKHTLNSPTFPKCPELLGTPLGNVLASMDRRSKLYSCFNRFLELDRIEAEGGAVVFLEEAQNGRYWGIPEGEVLLDDPSVVTTANEEVVNWEPEADRLSGFLQLMLSWQAVHSGWRYSRQFSGMQPIELLTSNNLLMIEHGVKQSGLELFSVDSYGVLLRDENSVCYVAAPNKKAWKVCADALGLEP